MTVSSPHDAVAEALENIRVWNPLVNAMLTVTADTVQTADGPLAGVPVAYKDCIDVAGVRSTYGNMRFKTHIAEADAEVVRRLKAAGTISVGKVNLAEFCYGGTGENAHFGAALNPWDPSRITGGSSSGTAAAVAAGMCRIGIGTDTGGSVRIPAAICGVVGLKPGRGLVSLRGVHPLSPALDTVGALARDVATAARMLGVISGPDGAEAERPPFDAEAALATGVEGLRLAAIPPEHLGGIDPEVARLYLAALDRLREAGLAVIMATPPRAIGESFAPNGVLMAAEGWRIWKDRVERHRAVMDPWIVRRLETGRTIPDGQLAGAHAQRIKDQAEFHAWFEAYDGLLTPTCPLAAPPLDEIDETTSPLSRLTRAANYFDLPGISVPMGLTDRGLPTGLQILGRARDEVTVVALGAAFERVSGWNMKSPDVQQFGLAK